MMHDTIEPMAAEIRFPNSVPMTPSPQYLAALHDFIDSQLSAFEQLALAFVRVAHESHSKKNVVKAVHQAARVMHVGNDILRSATPPLNTMAQVHIELVHAGDAFCKSIELLAEDLASLAVATAKARFSKTPFPQHNDARTRYREIVNMVLASQVNVLSEFFPILPIVAVGNGENRDSIAMVLSLALQIVGHNANVLASNQPPAPLKVAHQALRRAVSGYHHMFAFLESSMPQLPNQATFVVLSADEMDEDVFARWSFLLEH